MHPALAEAVEARQAAGLSRRQSEWMRRKARRECQRAKWLRRECRSTFGRTAALRPLEDVGPIFDEAELERVFVVLEGLGGDPEDNHSRAVRDRPHLVLVPRD
jgi:hypothetical protein